MTTNIDVGEILDFYTAHVKEIAHILQEESQLVEIEGDKVLIVGDLHGDLITLTKILSKYSISEWKIIFLGDYVDRGEYQIETLTQVLKLKLYHPDRVFLLRGNHESPLMNFEYGFVYELQEKLGDASLTLYKMILDYVFGKLPYAAVLNNQFFLVHGGLAREVKKVEDVRKLPRDDLEPKDRIVFQLLWNDPLDEITGFRPNYFRGCDPGGLCVYFWGPDVTEEFLRENSLRLIIRAHEYNEEGHKWNHSGKVLTVFSSRAGPYRFVNPKVVEIVNNDVKVVPI